MTQIVVADEKNYPLPSLYYNTHHDDNHELNANYEQTTTTIHLNQTNHNTKSLTKKNTTSWCKKKTKKEGRKKK